MNGFDYIVAKDYDRAWLNFELDLPLRPGKNGEPNPFYVNRPANPIAELTDALLAPFYRPPKFFFSGHRGCGKSTELLHLLSDPRITNKYWPINFSVREEADINDIDFRDVLLAIGGRLFREYRKKGGELPEQLLKELDGWKGKVEKHITTVLEGREDGKEMSAGIDLFFANAGMKMKLEPATRVELRQVVDTDITGLISIINHIATAIYSREHRIPLVLIDDMDKPDLDKARDIFHARREIMMQPNCAIVYTVSSALFYSKEFELHSGSGRVPAEHLSASAHGAPNTSQAGLRHAQQVRPRANGVGPDRSGSLGSGDYLQRWRVPRNGARSCERRSAAPAGERQASWSVSDVEWAAAEIRNEYRRILDKDDLKLLKKVSENNRMEYNERLRPLLQLLALLEYRDGENWCDVHPVLRKLLDD